jgi:hypothetical protein
LWNFRDKKAGQLETLFPMIRIAFIFILVIHGMIHLMRFAKAFHCAEIPALTKDISKPAGLFWMVTAIGFLRGNIIQLHLPDHIHSPSCIVLQAGIRFCYCNVQHDKLLFILLGQGKCGDVPFLALQPC